MSQAIRLLIATGIVAGTLLVGSVTASAETIFQSDFSHVTHDFWIGLNHVQNPGTIDIDAWKFASATSKAAMEIELLDDSMISFDVTASQGNLMLAISFWTDDETKLGTQTLLPIPTGGTYIALGSQAVNVPQLADTFRVVFWMSRGTATLDNLSVTTVPEPGTAALLSIGLGGLAICGRRRNG